LPAHIRAKPGEVAESVVTVGDPARARQVARMLQRARLVNSNRGLLTFTGTYAGKRVTVATHGLGGPSSAIVFEELRILGARTIVRLGTVGGMVKDLRIGDLVVVTGAASPEGSLRAYVPDGQLPALADRGLTSRMWEICRDEGLRHRTGVVISSDAFYGEDKDFIKRWAKRGVLGVEMECATLFTLGLLRGFRAASLLIVSDSLVNEGEKEVLPAERLEGFVESAAKVVLGALAGQ
jgi:5'-methylthioadenosine phosphorylase